MRVHQCYHNQVHAAGSVLAAVLFLAATDAAGAATITNGDVTLALGPTFFVDDAVTGGTDTTINEPGVGKYSRNCFGLLTAGQGPTDITLTGFGFATSVNETANDAETLTVSFTYLGADEAEGGGDDVFIGSAAGTYVYSGSGEYAFAFDTPLATNLNITGARFLIQVAPSSASLDGSVRFKVDALPYETSNGAKLSVAGTAVVEFPAIQRRVNLAKYQVTTASTENGDYLASYATDGVVGNDNSWRTLNVNSPHWAEVAFPIPVSVRSAHVYSGINDGLALASFKCQYWSGAAWVDVPGSSVTGNASTEVNVVFASSVASDRFRLYSDENGNKRVKEFALFPPNPDPDTGVEQGFPIGTDVELNLARKRPVVAGAADGIHYARLAVDGFVDAASMWQTTLVGSNALEIDLRISTRLGSAHLYSGSGPVPPLSDFTLQYWTGTAWATLPGGAVTLNTEAARVIPFTTEPIASKVRLVFTNLAVSAVKELCVFPANGGLGHALGRDVLAAHPPVEEFGDYSDAYYNVVNRAADLPIQVISNTPGLEAVSPDAEPAHYQILLNVGTDTYRLRNRATGQCLAGAGLSTNVGGLLVDEDYTAMPHQTWRLLPVDGTDFLLENQWSGLVMDTQGGSTAPGAPLVQAANDGSDSQRWRFVHQTHYPKKGSAGYVAAWEQFEANWSYNWGRTSTSEPVLPNHVVFHPMQWGNFNWNIGDSQGPLSQQISEWHRQDKAQWLLGFNEPDATEQSNLTVDKAIELWPRLERMDMPLVSPVAKNPDAAWMNDFMNQATGQGYRLDAIAAHNYPGPNGGSPNNLINLLQSFHNTWNLPVWLTEFSVVNWSGTGTWTEEDNYNWLAEFLWRAESLPWLHHYSLFSFKADATHPTPTNPWDPVGPRSNTWESDGTTPTPFGQLYMTWDGDASVRADTAYYVHNKAERKRLENDRGSVGPTHVSIRTSGSTVQWVMLASEVVGEFYIVSLRDGRRLRYVGGGTPLDLAPRHTTGSSLRWTLVENQYGWFYVENPSAPASARRLKDDAGTLSMVSDSNTGDALKWRFVRAYNPLDTQPPAEPVNLVASAGIDEIDLTWNVSSSPDFACFSLYRSTTSGIGYSLIASNLAATSHLDTNVIAGITYFYVATATDDVGYESGYSEEAFATPAAPLPDIPTNLTYVVSEGTILLGWPEDYTGWLLEAQTNDLSTGLGTNWSPIPGAGTTNQWSLPIDPSNPAVFFRLAHP